MKHAIMKKLIFGLALSVICATTFAQKITIDREVTMLALGDSYTIGQSVATGERWPHQFIDQLRALGIEAAYPDYIATTGWTTRRLIQGINTMLDQKKTYNLVSILIGVNNQYQGVDISIYEPDLREIIYKALLITGQDSSRVFVLSIPDWAYTPFGGGSSHISDEIDDYNAINKRIAAEYGIAYIDVTTISRLGLTIPSLVAGDGLHPSGKQYEEWVKETIPHLDIDQILSGADPSFLLEYHVKVFPNPTSSTLHIDSDLNFNRARVFNTLGSLVFDQALKTMPAQLDLSHLETGMYTLRLTHTNSKHQDIQKNIIIQALE